MKKFNRTIFFFNRNFKNPHRFGGPNTFSNECQSVVVVSCVYDMDGAS